MLTAAKAELILLLDMCLCVCVRVSVCARMCVFVLTFCARFFPLVDCIEMVTFFFVDDLFRKLIRGDLWLAEL